MPITSLTLGPRIIIENKRAYKDGAGRFWKSWDNSSDAFGSETRNIWEVGMTYTFSPKWLMNLAYARSNGDWASKYKQAYNIEFDYNGGRYPEMKPGNFGAFIAYRHMGRGAVIFPPMMKPIPLPITEPSGDSMSGQRMFR